MTTRRDFLRLGTGAAAVSSLPASIQRALAFPACVEKGTIEDVKHVVILMQENRSFDHYFGTLRGVRGFGDRFPIPLASGKPVWCQSDGQREITPFHLDREMMDAALIPGTKHDFPDAQAAWNQGKFGFWPKFKGESSMGYYTRSEAPFQYTLAEAFTICDAYYCSVTGGTDPNRIVFFSGSNFDPERRKRGEDSTDENSEPTNLRCWIKGTMPEPGYSYRGTAFKWATIPDVLDEARITWRIYQNPNDNWTGAMHGCLAFESFRTAPPGSSLYENGMKYWSLDHLRDDVMKNNLPQVCWVLPTQYQSEHPSGPSSPAQGGEFTRQVLNALTSNDKVWSKTVFFVTFDENDGLFDHMPPPAVPSYKLDGTPAGGSTPKLLLEGMYFVNDKKEFFDEKDVKWRRYLDPEDKISGDRRPWGLGPRVPMYVVSPWSKGGWVNSQVFDHTSVGQFIEKRFCIKIDAISPWHRAVCGDLTSAFDFADPNSSIPTSLPDMSGYAEIEKRSRRMPQAKAPTKPQPLRQELGYRRSRALPYELHVNAQVNADGKVELTFKNTGKQGVVFHVYDKLRLDDIPRRYTIAAGTVEAPTKLSDDHWRAVAGYYDLWVYGPNGFVRTFEGAVTPANAQVETDGLSYDAAKAELVLTVRNHGTSPATVTVTENAYSPIRPQENLMVLAGDSAPYRVTIAESHNWYDFTVTGKTANGMVYLERRFAGRWETGNPSISDPKMGMV